MTSASSTSSGLMDPQASSHISGIALRNRANSGRVTPTFSGDCMGEYKLRMSQVAGVWDNYAAPSRSHGPTGTASVGGYGSASGYDGAGRGSKGSSKGIGCGKGFGDSRGGASSSGYNSASAAGFVGHAGQLGSREV